MSSEAVVDSEPSTPVRRVRRRRINRTVQPPTLSPVPAVRVVASPLYVARAGQSVQVQTSPLPKNSVQQQSQQIICVTCRDSRTDIAFLPCGHHMCAPDITKLFLAARGFKVTPNRDSMFATFNHVKCPECRATIDMTRVNAKVNKFSSVVAVAKDEIYERLAGAPMVGQMCEYCSAPLSAIGGFRARILHYLDECLQIKMPCSMCNVNCNRVVGAHLDECTGLWCGHDRHCGFRGSKVRIAQHLRLICMSNEINAILQNTNHNNAVDLMNQVTTVYNSITTDMSDDTEVHPVMGEPLPDERGPRSNELPSDVPADQLRLSHGGVEVDTDSESDFTLTEDPISEIF